LLEFLKKLFTPEDIFSEEIAATKAAKEEKVAEEEAAKPETRKSKYDGPYRIQETEWSDGTIHYSIVHDTDEEKRDHANQMFIQFHWRVISKKSELEQMMDYVDKLNTPKAVIVGKKIIYP
jgi:hypothetical protein